MSTIPDAASPPADGDAQSLKKQLRWPDGVVLVFGLASGLFTSIGYTIGAVGGWEAITIWVAVCIVALLQNFLYAEMALMFPDKAGGIPVYAHEAWKKYFSLAGPTAANGYYMAWSFTLAIVSLVVGSLLKTQFFPDSTWTLSTGTADIGLEHILAATVCVVVYFFNVAGLKPALVLQYTLGIGLVFIIGVMIFVPWGHSGFDLGELHWLGDGSSAGLQTLIVFMYLAAWTVYGSEIAATFSPEFRDTRRDVPRAMIVGAALLVVLYLLAPLGAVGTIGEKAIAENPVGYPVEVFREVVGPASGLITLLLAGSLIMSIVSATADAGRALYGIAADDMTIKQLKPLSRRGVPVRQMTVDLLLNLLVLFFVGSPLAILYASNMGYFVCVLLALSGFLLLRRDRPGWPRPIKRGRAWIGVCVALIAWNAVLLGVGATHPGLAGYGGPQDVAIAFLLFLIGPALFLYRRIVQDDEPFRLRDRDDSEPPAAGLIEPPELAPAART